MGYSVPGMDRLLAEIDKILSDRRPLLNNILKFMGEKKGKTLRGALALAAAGAGKGISNEVVSIAAVIEILHLATLVHDDVIDNAPLRRGRESVQKKFGKKQAVLAGDYLFTACFNILKVNDIKQLDKFSKVVSRICEGEIEEQHNLGNYDMTTRRYLRIIRGKTAALFALSLYFGASVAEAPEDMARRLARIGYYMGMFFQILDDCGDYESSEAKAKKSVRHDLEQGVVTLPLICAIKREPKLKKLLKRNKARKVIKAVVQAGGTGDAREYAKKYFDKAMRHLSLLPDFETKNELRAIIEGAYGA